jgi:hypothetical protein
LRKSNAIPQTTLDRVVKPRMAHSTYDPERQILLHATQSLPLIPTDREKLSDREIQEKDGRRRLQSALTIKAHNSKIMISARQRQEGMKGPCNSQTAILDNKTTRKAERGKRCVIPILPSSEGFHLPSTSGCSFS